MKLTSLPPGRHFHQFLPSDSLSLYCSSLNLTFLPSWQVSTDCSRRPSWRHCIECCVYLSCGIPPCSSLKLGIYKRSVNKLTYCYTFTQLMSKKKRSLKYPESWNVSGQKIILPWRCR